MAKSIDYGNLMHDAMRGLIRKVLDGIKANGLPGDHHFFITFDTMHPDVELADWLSDRYPEEMTVVIQHWFDNLDVTDDGFSITLNFGDNPEPLYIPYDSIRTFVDPSVEFGLRFETQEVDADEMDEDDEALRPTAPQADVSTLKTTNADATDKGPKPSKAAEIVSLDKFRK
ncbi:MAG: ClpXP protease specificity-enhancing factor SspB [Celeribacter marinus]